MWLSWCLFLFESFLFFAGEWHGINFDQNYGDAAFHAVDVGRLAFWSLSFSWFLSQSWLISYLQVSWTLFGGPGKRVRYLGKIPTNHIWIRGKLDERIHLVGHSLGAHLMGKVSTSPTHIWTSIKNSPPIILCSASKNIFLLSASFCIKKYLFHTDVLTLGWPCIL